MITMLGCRYSQTLERGLKLLSDIQFPDRPDACENTPMHVHKLLGKGDRGRELHI